MRAFLRALRDPATYDVRRNVGLWLGFLLAAPIPILATTCSISPWIQALSWAAPFGWAVVLGAARHVAGLGDDRIHRMASDASAAGCVHAAERIAWRDGADSDRTERERLESLQRVMNAELALAQCVNRSLLPEDILRPDLEVVVRQIPCSFVGGDYLHADLPRPDVLYLCVGDVSGHGVSAALVVSRIHGLVRSLVLGLRPPDEIIGELHQATVRILAHASSFMTFAVFRVDLAARRIDYATAGHPSQFLFRRDGGVESLTTGNGLLGSRHPGILGALRAGTTTYEPGDTLVLFTDGLYEIAARAGGRMLGESGLLTSLGHVAGTAPDLVASGILRTVAEFGRIGPFADDVSLMVARFGPAPGAGGATHASRAVSSGLAARVAAAAN